MPGDELMLELVRQAPAVAVLLWAVSRLDVRLERLEAVIRERDGDLIEALMKQQQGRP